MFALTTVMEAQSDVHIPVVYIPELQKELNEVEVRLARHARNSEDHARLVPDMRRLSEEGDKEVLVVLLSTVLQSQANGLIELRSIMASLNRHKDVMDSMRSAVERLADVPNAAELHSRLIDTIARVLIRKSEECEALKSNAKWFALEKEAFQSNTRGRTDE